MKNRKQIILLVISLVFLASVSVGVSAWFLVRDNVDSKGDMGVVNAVVQGSKASSSFRTMSSESTKSLKREFSVKNNSSIESFVRIGYMVSYKKDNADILLDSSESKASNGNFNLTVTGKAVTSTLMQGTTQSGYSKDFIYPIVNSGGKDVYYRIPPGQNISGYITINGLDAEAVSDIVITTETIQATKKALVEAESYGWNSNYFE